MYKVYVPPAFENNSTLGRLRPLHRRTRDSAEGQCSRNSVRRSQHSNKWDGSW